MHDCRFSVSRNLFRTVFATPRSRIMFRKPQCTEILCHRAASAWRIRNIASSQSHSLPPPVVERRPLTPRGAFPCFLPTTTLTGIREKQGSTSIARFISSTASHQLSYKTFHPGHEHGHGNIVKATVTFFEKFARSIHPRHRIIIAALAGGFLGCLLGYLLAAFLVMMHHPMLIISNKILERLKDDAQVKERIGSPIEIYGSPYRVWITDKDGVQHLETEWNIWGAHGRGKIFCQMFIGPLDMEWKFAYLKVEIRDPFPEHFLLELNTSAYSPNK